uniref:CHK kinase-like domain-containing protein n=1 Tax=Homalodisca liturata TaxID=320908 RepID=A0A1B6JXJ1_9HEMI
MECPIPDWLTKQFLSDCLQDIEGKKADVTNFRVSPAGPPGSSYGSCLIRVKIEYRLGTEDRTHCLSLIIKSELTGPTKDLVDPFCEPAFYKKFLPEASKLTDTSFVPRIFFSPYFTTIVMEDLQEQGFIMADKGKQLDFDHCKLYMVTVAKLHAVSFAVHKKHPELVESMGKEKLFSEDRITSLVFKRMICGGLASMAEATEKLDRFKHYSKLIKDTSAKLWEMLMAAHKPSKVLNTLNHGDPWIPNIMFKYDDEGFVSNIKLLDFQASRYGSPINDLAFFIWTSANSDVRGNRLHELYDIYLDTFNDKLKQLNCTESLTHESLMENMKRLSPLAIFSVGIIHPNLDNSAQVDLGLFYKENNDNEVKMFYDRYYNAIYVNGHFSKCMEHLESAGVFEHLEKYISSQK